MPEPTKFTIIHHPKAEIGEDEDVLGVSIDSGMVLINGPKSYSQHFSIGLEQWDVLVAAVKHLRSLETVYDNH